MRLGLLKVAPRVQGKILKTQAGTKFMLIEQNGKNIWRGKEKSIHAAREKEIAMVGADRVLLQRARKYEVTVIVIANTTHKCMYICNLEDFFNRDIAKLRTNYQRRAHTVLPLDFFVTRSLKPKLC